MKFLGRYAGRKTVASAWTATVALAVGVWVVESWPPGTADAWRLGGGAVALWVVGLAGFRYRARRQWRRMAADGQFETQANRRGTYPPLQGTIRGRTVTIEVTAPHLFADVHTRVETSVDGVTGGVAVRARYVGTGGQSRGRDVGNPTLDETFVFHGETPDVLRTVLTPEVQSALMDLDAPGDLTITGRTVAYDVPFAHLSATQLRQCANVVATVAVGVEETVD